MLSSISPEGCTTHAKPLGCGIHRTSLELKRFADALTLALFSSVLVVDCGTSLVIELRRQLLEQQLLAATHRERVLHHVSEFANVPGPTVIE